MEICNVLQLTVSEYSTKLVNGLLLIIPKVITDKGFHGYRQIYARDQKING